MCLKKVLIINDEVELYGAEVNLLEMATSLKEFTPIVLLPRNGTLQQKLQQNKVKVIVKHFRRSSLNFFEGIKLFFLLREIVKKYKIEILHLNKYLKFTNIVWLVAVTKRIPIIIHIRGEVWPEIIDKVVISLFNKIVCVSEKNKEYLVRKRRSDLLIKIPRNKVEVIYDGKDLDKFKFSIEKRLSVRKSYGIEEKQIVVALIGYFSPNKGQERFVNLANGLLELNSNLKFLLIGGVTSKSEALYRERVKSLIELSGLKDNFILSGFIETNTIYHCIDFLVCLSESEGTPHVLIEAMAAERVVIANSVGGVPEVIGNNGAGFLVEPNNIIKIRDIIMRLSYNEKSKEEIGKKAKERAKKLFDINLQVSKIERLYENILSK